MLTEIVVVVASVVIVLAYAIYARSMSVHFIYIYSNNTLSKCVTSDLMSAGITTKFIVIINESLIIV